jgi:carbamoyltransferase
LQGFSVPKRFGEVGPRTPRSAKLAQNIAHPIYKRIGERRSLYSADSDYARAQATSMQEKLHRGEPIHLLGLSVMGHDSGASLVRIDPKDGIQLLCNNEEERYSGFKHDRAHPQLALETLLEQMKEWGIGVEDIHTCLGTWDLTDHFASAAAYAFGDVRELLLHLPKILPGGRKIRPSTATAKRRPGRTGFATAELLGQQLGRKGAMPIIMMRHHDNHAYFSYAVSPFAGSPEPVAISVIDAAGDDGAISLYIAQGQDIRLVYNNRSKFDSLGTFYSILSSTQGGWSAFSAAGRYMGAAAWGNNDRQTNPYYHRLRQLVYFGDDGAIQLNRKMWTGYARPYAKDLEAILGLPIPADKIWNPDAVLNVEDIQHPELTKERLDRAAAVQRVFEDALFHVIGNLLRKTGSSKLVVTGGTALNCIANMQLLEHFNEEFYERYTGQKGKRLEVWIPPTPGDSGVTMGAAYTFAMANGAPLGERLQHAFYCGMEPTSSEIMEALESDSEIEFMQLGNIRDPQWRDFIADLLAYAVSQDGVLGLYQGIAETGPRALGHRSILANPCNPRTRENLNALVKFREAVRPLAPMATLEAARQLFDLSPGASADGYNAYNYMVLCVRALPEAYALIPAVIHKDGTGRIQIVRKETDPFTHAYLKAMGRRAGVEVSVNTSLNVGSPIVQTPQHALTTLKRSKGMHGLLMIGSNGEAFLSWHAVDSHPKDSGRTIQRWVREWNAERGVLAFAPQPS